MRYGSVCSGIESASVAWHPLGWRPAWFAEVDKACSRLLRKRFPEVVNLGDMTALPDRVRSGEIEAPDVLVGGTPCQDFSIAGMRAGLKGTRGQLTMTYVELADAIDEQRPGDECVVCWENVPGVLNHKDNPFGNFLAALVGEHVPLVPAGKRWTDAGVVLGPRRAVAWRCLDAQYFGLAQRRKRVFVVASARAGFDPAAVLLEFEGVRRDTPPRLEAGQGVTHTLAPCLTSSGRGVERTGDPRGQDAVVAVRAYGGGNTAGPIAAATALNANERYDFDSETFVVQPAIAFSAKDYGGDATADMSPTLRSMGHSGSHANGGGQVAVCVTGDVTHTLKAEGFDASEDGTGRGQPIVTTPMAVRRLMPVECERLQGFPDGWTEGQVDGPRYKQLGNSKAVPVVRWIGRRIEAEMRRGVVSRLTELTRAFD